MAAQRMEIMDPCQVDPALLLQKNTNRPPFSHAVPKVDISQLASLPIGRGGFEAFPNHSCICWKNDEGDSPKFNRAVYTMVELGTIGSLSIYLVLIKASQLSLMLVCKAAKIWTGEDLFQVF